jgi:hypothetical protein
MGALTSLDISENSLYAEGSKLLAEALKSNPVMTALNISSNNMTFDGGDSFEDMSGVTAIANAIPDMRALSSLNLANNNTGELVLPEGWTEEEEEDEHGYEYDVTVYMHVDGRKQEEHPGRPEGAIALANAIKDFRVLLSLDLTRNNIPSYVLASIIHDLKNNAVHRQRACACLVGHEFTTRDLRAVLVATRNLNPSCWLPAIAIEHFCKDIVMWL